MRLRPATPLSIILLAAFALLLLSVLSTPIIPAIHLASYGAVTFGVFGYCGGQGTTGCSGMRIGYNMADLEPTNSDFSLPSNARNSLTNLLIVHPIAALFTLICLVLSLLSHLRGPSHSPRYLLALLILFIPTFLLSLLAFLVDILIFLPHVQWGGWIVLAATILIALAGIVTCGMRRTLVSKVARRKRIQETATNGTEYYAQQQQSSTTVAVPPPASVVGSVVTNDKLPEFATFEVDKPARGEQEGERIPLNPRSRTVSPPLPEDRVGVSNNSFNNPSNPSLRRAPSDRSEGYGPPQRGAGPLSRPMPPGQVRGQYSNTGGPGPYGPPPQQRGYGPPQGGGYGGDGPYRGGPPGPNGPGGFNGGTGLAPPPRRGPGPGRGGPPPGMRDPYGGGGQYGMGPRNGPDMGPRNMGPDNGMGPRNMGPDGMGPRNGMGPGNGMGPRNMGPDGMGPRNMGSDGLGPRNMGPGGIGRGGMGPDNGMVPRNLGHDNGMGPGGPQGGMAMGPGNRRSIPEPPRAFDYPSEEQPVIDERHEFEQTLLPPATTIGVAATTDDYPPSTQAAIELPGDLHREPTPPRLSVVNETRTSVQYEDNEYVPPRAAWTGQTSNTPPPPAPVELPAVSRATVLPRPSDSYYEDVAPAFDSMHHAHPPALTPGGSPAPPFPLQIPQQPQSQQQQMTLEQLQDGQRSPAMSTTSNFTSISQRPPNPNWQPGYAPPMPGSMGMGGPAPRRGPTSSQLLGGNPDFELPGVGPRGRGGRGLGMGR